MKIVKTAYQQQSDGYVEAHETAYIIKGIFRKKVYRLDLLAVVELPTLKQKGQDEKEAK